MFALEVIRKLRLIGFRSALSLFRNHEGPEYYAYAPGAYNAEADRAAALAYLGLPQDWAYSHRALKRAKGAHPYTTAGAKWFIYDFEHDYADVKAREIDMNVPVAE